MSKYRLSIANLVGVQVKGSTRDSQGVEQPFDFILVCDRLPSAELQQVMSQPEATANDFFARHAKDWRRQQLVLDDQGQPAPFSPDALAVMFGIAGMSAVCWQAYLAQVMVASKN